MTSKINLINSDFDQNETTPVDLAAKLFSNIPAPENSNKLLPHVDDSSDFNLDNFDHNAFNFEILITIFMEGILHLSKLLDVLDGIHVDINSNNYDDDVDIFKLEISHLEILQPWFNSIGYKLNAYEYDFDDFSENYYCKILLKDNPEDTGYFIYRNINIPYHFVLNSNYLHKKNINQISAVFIKPATSNTKKKVFSISFFPLT
jgi:hypothetical protein